MPSHTHAIVRTDLLHEGWTKFLVATIRLPDGRTATREIEDHGAAICVLPCNLKRRTAVLVRQFRAPPFYALKEEDTVEAIAGTLEEEDPVDCARREAREEAGLALDTIEYLFTGWTMPGISTERMHFFLGTYVDDIADGRRGGLPHEHEDTLTVETSLAELARLVDAGEINDVKTLLLIQTARLRYPQLFSA